MELRRLLSTGLVTLFAVSLFGCQDNTREVRFDEDTQESRAQGEIPGRSHSRFPEYSDEEQLLTLRELPAGREHEYYVNQFRDLQFGVEDARKSGNEFTYLLVRNGDRYRVTLTKQGQEPDDDVITRIQVEQLADKEPFPQSENLGQSEYGDRP